MLILKSDKDSLKKGNAAAVFSLKESVTGRKRVPQEPAAIRDPSSNQLVTNPSKIKAVTLKYCVDLLTNKTPSPKYEEVIEVKRNLHDQRMLERVDNDIELSEKIFYESLESVRKTKGEKYESILKGGSSLKLALFHLYKHVWRTEEKPDQWRLDTLFQLHKKN